MSDKTKSEAIKRLATEGELAPVELSAGSNASRRRLYRMTLRVYLSRFRCYTSPGSLTSSTLKFGVRKRRKLSAGDGNSIALSSIPHKFHPASRIYYKAVEEEEIHHHFIITNTKNMKIPFPQNLIHQLTKVISSITTIHSIYLIGSKKVNISYGYTFDPEEKLIPELNCYSLSIVIITYGKFSVSKEFMNLIYTKMQEKVQVYPILYSHNEIERQLLFGDNFLIRVLEKKNLMFGPNTLNPYRYTHHPKFYDPIAKEWEFRVKRAEYFMGKAFVIDDIYDPSAKMLLLSQAVQQGCASLLSVFWEWRPSFYDLDYLLNLCSNFSSSPEIIFPKRSFRSHKFYSGLCQAQFDVNFKSYSDISDDLTFYAYRVCQRFLESAEKEGARKLQELYNIHHSS